MLKLTTGRDLSITLASRQAGETVPLSNTVSLIGRYEKGEEIKIRMQVFGVNPTVIRAKVWRGAETEPTAWAVTAQDGFDRLQRSGVVGWRCAASTARRFPRSAPPVGAGSWSAASGDRLAMENDDGVHATNSDRIGSQG